MNWTYFIIDELSKVIESTRNLLELNNDSIVLLNLLNIAKL